MNSVENILVMNHVFGSEQFVTFVIPMGKFILSSLLLIFFLSLGIKRKVQRVLQQTSYYLTGIDNSLTDEEGRLALTLDR